MARSDTSGLASMLAGAALFGLAAWQAARRQQPRPAVAGRHTASRAAAAAADAGTRRGRDAEGPAEIPARGWKDIAFRVWKEMGEDHLGLIAAGVAFYAILALFPAMAVAVALTGLVTEPEDFVQMLNGVSELMPAAAAEILIGQATDIAGSREGGLGLAAVTGLALAIWSASRGMVSLIEGLNVTYDETERRGLVKLNLVALGLTVVVILGALMGLVAAVVVPAVLALAGSYGGLAGWLPALRWPILILGTLFGLAVIYRYGPSRENARWRWITPGSALACLLWLLATFAFAWYAGSFANYNETFGTLGGAIVLLMWLWLSAYAVLVGAEVNAEIEAQTARDSTTGPELPMGRRGAVKADTLGLAADGG